MQIESIKLMTIFEAKMGQTEEGKKRNFSLNYLRYRDSYQIII